MLHRFYEPLMLLDLKVLRKVLGNIRGPRTMPSTDPSNMNTPVVNAFSTNLAVLGDYEKGGVTVTAISIEDNERTNVFWVAANTDPAPMIVPFLENTLRTLRSKRDLGADINAPNAQAFIDKLVRFGTKRIKEEAKCVARQVKVCPGVMTSDQSCKGEREFYPGLAIHIEDVLVAEWVLTHFTLPRTGDLAATIRCQVGLCLTMQARVRAEALELRPNARRKGSGPAKKRGHSRPRLALYLGQTLHRTTGTSISGRAGSSRS